MKALTPGQYPLALVQPVFDYLKSCPEVLAAWVLESIEPKPENEICYVFALLTALDDARHIEHAVGTVNDLRAGKTTVNDLVERLANDERIPLDRAQLAAIVAAGESNAGAARAQVAMFAKAVASLEAAHPEAAAYAPGSIL